MANIVNERTAALVIGTLYDETGAVVPAASLASLELTLYDWNTRSIINSRTKQNVLNTNNVTASSCGGVQYTMQPLDNIIVSPTLNSSEEQHRALFQWTYGAGLGGYTEIPIYVTNLALASSS